MISQKKKNDRFDIISKNITVGSEMEGAIILFSYHHIY